MKIYIISLLLVIAFTLSLFADPIYVPDDYSTIQAAVNAATSDENEIIVRDGIYTENVNIGSYTVILHSENGPENCIIEASGQHCIHNYSAWLIEGFTLRNASNGALINDNDDCSIKNCIFENNENDGQYYSYYGSAIASSACIQELSGCIFRNNTGKYTVSFMVESGYTPGTIIKNNLFVSNYNQGTWPYSSGEDICIENYINGQDSWTIENNTFLDFGAIYVAHLETADEVVDIKNCIFGTTTNAIEDGNQYGNNGHIYNPENIIITFSCFSGDGYEGIYGGGFGNLVQTDPLLCHEGDYRGHLLETSPCIDAGAFDMTDPDGTRIDMGCYASTTDIKKTKVDHYNWVSFPRLDRNDNDYVIAPPVLENYINWPFDLDLYYNTENYEYSQLNYSISTHTWTPGYYEIKSSYGYKLNPELTSYLPLDGSRLPADYELTYSIQPNQYEWLGYWIAKSQNIVDAFGDLWQNVEKVKAEDWYYDRLSIIKGDDVPATASFSTKNKTMEYGKGYMIWFKDNSVSNFHWTDSGPFTKPVKKEQPENFTYTDKPDYEVIDVVSIPADIREIGVFKNNECVGAVVVKDSCEQILVYSDDANRYQVSFSFEIVTEGSKTSSIKDYEVFNPKTGKFEDNTLVTGGQEHSIIKFIDLGNGEIVPENTKVELYENYPNPFNPTTTISFSLPKEGDIKLDIYNMKGQVVKTLYSGIAEKGKHSIMWNGKNSNNKTVTSGLYFYKLRTSGKTITKKMLMLK